MEALLMKQFFLLYTNLTLRRNGKTRRVGTRLILGLGTIKNIKDIRDKVQRALNNPTELSNLLCKDFNVRMTENTRWLSFEIASNEATFEPDEIYDSYAIGGVDLSSTTDLTCATCLVVKGDTKYVMQQYFIPSQHLQRKIKDDKIPYDIWEQKGLVTVCEGAKVNYTDVTEWFLKLQSEYEISTVFVGYDPWNSRLLDTRNAKRRFSVCLKSASGAKTMSNPMKQLEADLIDKKINYNNNPVLKWCLTNTEVKRDENDNIRPVKRKENYRKDRWSSKPDYSLLRFI